MAQLVFKEKDGAINMIVTGQLTREPELNRKGDTVKFSVAYGKKKYRNVQAWADSHAGRLAGCLEKGDHVLAAGVWEQWDYDGKSYDALKADYLAVQEDAPMAAEEYEPDAPEDAPQGRSAFMEIDDAPGELPF